ncbi:unnamed protein product [Peniophora sp. CBMAI 1063]|nr:unnamed protein product [Peniophora sp. CBMAI 1063]
MAPRVPSSAAQEATDRVRAVARARQMCGEGSLTDIVDPKFLKAMLSTFFATAQDMDIPVGRVALNRAKRALDAVSEVSKGATRITKAVARTAWALLLVEMKFARKYNAPASVEPIERFIETVTREARRDNSWDIGKVRGFLARGWPEEQTVRKLKANEIGTVHWWHAIGNLKDKEPLLRQNIYDAAYALRAPSPPRPTAASSAGSRPGREAAEATNAALRGAEIIDDDRGGTYSPANIDAAEPRVNDAQAARPRFGENAAASFTFSVPAGVDHAPPPPPPPPPPGASRRAQPSPWLPPSGFTADLKWNIPDYHEHKRLLLRWPRGQHAPDSVVWEHPHAHGLRVLEDGLPVTSKKPCTNCSKQYYTCIPRGSKACLPCYWEKGSQGRCEGNIPPDGPVQKPDFKIRTQYLRELDAAGVYPFPHHYVLEDGRARHGAGAGGIGKPPAYPSPAPRYSPPRATSTALDPTSAAPSSSSAAPPTSATGLPPPAGPEAASQQATAEEYGAQEPAAPASASESAAAAAHDIAAVDDDMLVDNYSPADAQPDLATVSAENVTAAHEDDVSHRGPQQQSSRLGNGADLNAAREDSAMADLSNMPAGTRKRPRVPAAGENELPTAQAGAAPGDAQPPRKRKRREGPTAAPKPSPANDSGAPAPSRPMEGSLRPAAVASTAPVESEVESAQDTATDVPEPPSRSQSSMASPAPEQERQAARPVRPADGKGKSRAVHRPRGDEQRGQSSSSSRGVQFHPPAPGTRPVPSAAGPRFGGRPRPVIPDSDMRVEGDRPYEASSGGVSRISYPQGAPPPMSTLNLSGDIFLANHVERALCHEMRDVSNHHRDWILGRYENEHVLPRHREIIRSLQELRDRIAPQALDPYAGRTAAAAISGQSIPVQALGNPARAIPGDPSVTAAARTTPPPTTGISETRLTEILAESFAPFHDMAGNVQDLTRRFAELEPIAGRVSEMSGRVDGMSGRVDIMGADMQALVARVQRLEDVSPLARNIRVFSEHQDRVGKAAAPILVLRAPEPAHQSVSQPPPERRQAGRTESSPSRASLSISVSRALDRAREASSVELSSSGGIVPPVGDNPAPSQRAPCPDEDSVAADDTSFTRRSSPQHEVPLAAADPLTPIREASSGPKNNPRSASLVSHSLGHPPSLDVEMANAGMPTTPTSESPLTTSPSPGNYRPAVPTIPANTARSPQPQIAAKARSAQAESNADEGSSDDDVPMETGEDWALGDSRKRGEDEEGEPEGQRPAKRRAGDLSSGDEDADGSSDDQAPPQPARATASQVPASRVGKGRGAAAARGNAGRGKGANARRAGLRDRAPRSG